MVEVWLLREGLENVLKYKQYEKNENSKGETYRVQREEAPEQDGNLLEERDNVETLGQVSSIRVHNVLEVLGESFIESIQVHPTMNDTKQSEDLVRCQVFYGLFLQSLVHVKLTGAAARPRLHGSSGTHEVVEHLGETDVAAANQIIQVVKTRWLVLNKHQQ